MDNQASEIAKNSNSSFYYAFSLLPTEKRDAMNTVYAFCRETDDIVDEGEDNPDVKHENLRKWRLELEKAFLGNSNYQLLNKLANIIRQFNIPVDPFFDLIKGMEMDLEKKRYLNIDDLMLYCYRVASTVGLMCIEIFGYKNRSAKDYAINLGLAMQLTNILRDIKPDAQRGRIYLPQEDLIKYNYGEDQLFKSVYNKEFVSLMEFEANRARDYFSKANKCLDLEDKESMFAARSMQHIYFKLLQKIEKSQFNVFNEKIRVSSFQKVGISLGVWLKYNLVY